MKKRMCLCISFLLGLTVISPAGDGTNNAQAPQWMGTNVGKYLKFDGVGDYVNCGHQPSLNITNAISVAFWVRGDQFGHESGFINKPGAYSVSKRHSTVIGGIYFGLRIGGTGTDGACCWEPHKFLLDNGKWHHLVLTYDSGTTLARGYLNGKLCSTINMKEKYPGLPGYTINVSGNDLVLAKGKFYLNGCLDEVYLYSRALSDEEAGKIYRNEEISKGGLVGLWKFEEGVGAVTADLSGNGNTGKLSQRLPLSQLPNLGGEISVPVLYSNPDLTIWLQNATAKVMRGDMPLPSDPDPEISVSLARNEYEPFQIALLPKKQLKGIKISFSDLAKKFSFLDLFNPGKKNLIAKENITGNMVEYIPVIEPSRTGTPKKLIEGEAGSMFWNQKSEAGWYPDPLPGIKAAFDANETRNYPLWITIYAPADISAGTYAGNITITGANFQPITLKLKVNIWDFALPEVFHTHNVAPFDKCGLQKGDKGKYGSGAEMKEIYKNFARHYFTIFAILPEPVLTFKGTEAIIDAAEFDKSASYLLDELKVNNFYFPIVGWYNPLPFQRGELAVDKNWHGFIMSDKPGVLRDDFLAAYTNYIHKMSGHLREKGWFGKTKLGIIDEPQGETAFSIIRQAAKAIKAVEPNLKIIETKWPKPELIGSVDIWCLGYMQPKMMKEALARGEQLECYPNWNSIIDWAGMNTRTIGWMMWKYHITGVLLWSTTYGWAIGKNIWLTPRFDYPNGKHLLWGNGLFLYPDDNFNPINSIRWELYRETFEDYEYLYHLDELCTQLSGKELNAKETKILNEAREYMKTIVDKIVPCWEAYDDKLQWKGTIWETDEKVVYQAREKIASFIQSLSGIKKEKKRRK